MEAQGLPHELLDSVNHVCFLAHIFGRDLIDSFEYFDQVVNAGTNTFRLNSIVSLLLVHWPLVLFFEIESVDVGGEGDEIIH